MFFQAYKTSLNDAISALQTRLILLDVSEDIALTTLSASLVALKGGYALTLLELKEISLQSSGLVFNELLNYINDFNVTHSNLAPTQQEYISLYTLLKFHLEAELITIQIEQQNIIPSSLTKPKANAMTQAKAKRLYQLKALKIWLNYLVETKKTPPKSVSFEQVYNRLTILNLKKKPLNVA
ncbi:MAG: hypothetical protein IBX55_17710 [Methyloprofundus sp.]|nr:hypothetical protein [Methyloprofundus sp.]